jgi:hypothetical protein
VHHHGLPGTRPLLGTAEASADSEAAAFSNLKSLCASAGVMPSTYHVTIARRLIELGFFLNLFFLYHPAVQNHPRVVLYLWCHVNCTGDTCEPHKSCRLPPHHPLRHAPAASNVPNLTLNKPPRARAARPSTAARACNCKCARFRRAQRPQIYGAIARCEQGNEGKLTALHPRCAGMQPHLMR